MTEPLDTKDRVRAITEIGATLLVEAAAGTGKTAIMAARVTYMLAKGIAPGAIAAITFTEPAASALSERVQHYVDELLDGGCPKPLGAVLSKTLDPEETQNLRSALLRLDELTVTTIHAFCRTIISSYAVEANIDPGARILDGDQAAAVFGDIFERWLKRRLDGRAEPGDAIAVLSRDNPRDVADTLRELALCRLDHRRARTPLVDLSGRPDVDLMEALDSFRRWVASAPLEPKTAELLADLEQLCSHFADGFATPPNFAKLWSLAHPPRIDRLMRWKSLDLKEPRLKGAWQKAVGREDAAAMADAVTSGFDEVRRCYRIVMGRVATAIVARLSIELDEILKEYEDFKRAAALLDFDSLLERAQHLVATHDDVRRELGRRYTHILVDEFQDTDPVQSEILFQIAADETAARWIDNRLRPGSLFVVGDPKQSIYRFRGADIDAYELVRAAIKTRWPENIVTITTNFRSRPGILGHVNARFEAPLNASGQPGYVALTPFLPKPAHEMPSVAKLIVEVPREAKADDIRDAEAEAVALQCRRLIGKYRIEDADGAVRTVRAGDITLLSPTRTGLLRYERALEENGLPIASQAGKGLFRRQETQDMIALARLLADPNDTLAFGAFMRGPFVGLSEEVLLDITAALPATETNRPSRFSIRTEPGHVPHELARDTLVTLRDLRTRTRSVSPAQLLTESVERLRLRAVLALREPQSGGRAIANLEAFIERARPFGVRGLKSFVRQATRDFADGRAASEGQLDSDVDAINIITLHSAKGLEWAVVIPVNMATMPRPHGTFVHRVSDNTIHMMLGDVVPPDLTAALDGEETMLRREQERLWYVTSTRARELLILPQLGEAGARSWARIINQGFDTLPALDLATPASMGGDTAEAAGESNHQTKDVFEAERAKIAVRTKPIIWRRPSDGDDDRAQVIEALAHELDDAPEAELPIGAGRLRGLVLHKLIEEILTGELTDEDKALAERAGILTAALAVEEEEGAVLPDAAEMARTVARTLAHPEINTLRPRLVPEWPIYGLLAPRNDLAVSGRIDAVALEDNGQADIVVDWKSDVAPSDQAMEHHRGQMGDYLKLSGAPRGFLFYMTTGTLRWVERSA